MLDRANSEARSEEALYVTSPPAEAERFGFAWDIAMALRNVALYCGPRQSLTLEQKLAIGLTILEHLQISGVLLSPKPPLASHGRRPAPINDGK